MSAINIFSLRHGGKWYVRVLLNGRQSLCLSPVTCCVFCAAWYPVRSCRETREVHDPRRRNKMSSCPSTHQPLSWNKTNTVDALCLSRPAKNPQNMKYIATAGHLLREPTAVDTPNDTTTAILPNTDASCRQVNNSLFQLLLGAQLVGVATLLLAAIHGTGRQTGVAPTNAKAQHRISRRPRIQTGNWANLLHQKRQPHSTKCNGSRHAATVGNVTTNRHKTTHSLAANHTFAVVLLGQGSQGGLNHTTTQTQHQVQRGLLLDVVVAECAAVFQLLAGEDQALLIRRDALLVLNLGLHVLQTSTAT
jgi:hypothetical protein